MNKNEGFSKENEGFSKEEEEFFSEGDRIAQTEDGKTVIATSRDTTGSTAEFDKEMAQTELEAEARKSAAFDTDGISNLKKAA